MLKQISFFSLFLFVSIVQCNPKPVAINTLPDHQDNDTDNNQKSLCMTGQIFLEGKCWVLCENNPNICVAQFICDRFLGYSVCIRNDNSHQNNSDDDSNNNNSVSFDDTDNQSNIDSDNHIVEEDDPNNVQEPDAEGFTLLWNQDFDPNDCFKNWEKQNAGELKPECKFSEKEPQTTVLSIRHPENGSGSNQFAYVWLKNPLEGYETYQELRIEVRYRYRTITGWGTRAFQIGTGDNPDSGNNADILNMAHHELQYILDFFGHHYLKVGNFDFTTIRITYKPQSGDTQFVIYKENGDIAKDVNNDESIDKSGNKPKAKLFMIGSPFVAHENGWWGGVEIDYVKLFGK